MSDGEWLTVVSNKKNPDGTFTIRALTSAGELLERTFQPDDNIERIVPGYDPKMN